MDISTLIRPNILALAPYSCARSEFKGEASIFVDANESPYQNGVNRYPDPMQTEVKALLAPLKGVRPEQIFLGNGSDEAIDLIYRIFCQPRFDNVVAISPSYGMYQVCADINDVQYRAVELTADYQINRHALTSRIDARTKVLWFCSPNNPTGNAFAPEEFEWFLEQYPNKIVVVDEAYIDFSGQPSMLTRLDKYPNLIVLQTLSKAWGQAAIRCGIAYACPELMAFFNNVKYPYNVNILTQQQAIRALREVGEQQQHVREVLAQRDVLAGLLQQLSIVDHIYPSDANFLLVRFRRSATEVYQYLLDRGIITRNRTRVPLCRDCIRITVGTPEENVTLIKALKEL